MSYRRRALAIVLVAFLLGATVAFAAFPDNAAPTQNEIPVTTDQTPTVVLETGSGGTEVDLVNMWEGDQLNITTTEGNITVSGDSGASAHLDVTAIEGTQTQVTQIDAGSNWINLNPADKNRVDVRGDADTLAFEQIAVDDGSSDIQLGGPTGGTAELRLHDLASNTTYAFYDANRGEVLGSLTTDSTGTGAGTVDMPDGTQSLQVRTADSFADPTLSNPTPTGQITEKPTELAVDVDADAYPAEVEFTLEGSTVGTETVSSDGTVSTPVTIDTLGTYNWSATVTDGVSQTDTVSSSFETPSTLTLREEAGNHSIIDNSTVTVRFYSADGDIAIERDITNGTLGMDGLPASEFVVFAESPEHYDRRAYIGSIFDQDTMFLLNETKYPRDTNDAIRSRFVYEDLTGEFPRSKTTIQVQRAIDLNDDGTSEYRTVAGDYWGASNEFAGIFEYGTRYRIVLVNQETGARNVAGTHVPIEDLSQTIRVSGLVEEAKNETGVVGLAELNQSTSQIEIAYRDPVNQTDSLEIIVESRGGGDRLFNETVAGPLGSYTRTVELNESQLEKDWVVRFNAGDRHRSAIPVGTGTIGLPFGMPGWLMSLLMSMAVTFVGALYGPRTAVMGSWAMVFVAAGVSMFGWAFSPASVVVAALVAVGVTLMSRALP